jgi:hypothetical protein
MEKKKFKSWPVTPQEFAILKLEGKKKEISWKRARREARLQFFGADMEASRGRDLWELWLSFPRGEAGFSTPQDCPRRRAILLRSK